MDGPGADLAAYSCNLELLVVFFLHWKLFCWPVSQILSFLSPTLMAQSAWKKLQSQIIHCNPPFEEPNASNWAFMTYKLYLPLFFPFFPLWRLFSFLPATLRSDIEPLPVGVLSCLTPVHIFAVPSLPPPDNELSTEYIIRAVVLFVVVLASKKRDELLMMTDKKERGGWKKKKL